uniref:Uncharacterized protein n=1 Tax=Rhizophora mucronata TaxID=61149 RepID=A0A2P2QNG9_RHIMU
MVVGGTGSGPCSKLEPRFKLVS